MEKQASQGKIIYDIEIIGDDLDPFMVSMMPSQAEFFFKEEKTALFLSSRGNLVRFAAFSNASERTIVQEIKLMNKKVKAEFDDKEIFFYMERPNFTMIPPNMNDTLAGLHVDADLVIYDEIDTKESIIYYSKDLKVMDPNWYTIYAEIPYVLLQYEFNQFGLKLKMKAKSIEYLKIDDDFFTSSEEYREVSSEEFIKEVKIIAESL